MACCSVPNCSGRGGFSFPPEANLRKRWCISIRREKNDGSHRLWEPDCNSRICDRHFRPEDMVELEPKVGSGVSRRLHSGTIPSLNLPRQTTSKFNYERSMCALRRSNTSNLDNFRNNEERTHENEDEPNICPEENKEHGQPDERPGGRKKHGQEYMDKPIRVLQLRDTAVQTENPRPSENSYQTENINETENYGILNVNVLRTKYPERFLYYSGFINYEHFKFVLNCLGPAAYDLRYKPEYMSIEDQFLLTLIKLRQAKEFVELSLFFGISENTVSKVFHTWLAFMFFQLQELDLWIPREVIDDHLPEFFKKKYPSTRIIIGGTEIPICKPSKLEHQMASYSTNKNSNTLKILVGISPKGLVTFISETYGGSVSDREILERSKLLNEGKFEVGDSIMTNRGLTVQDLFLQKNVHLNVPKCMHGNNKLPPETVNRGRKIPKKRLHVEKIIGEAKKFKILQGPLYHSFVPLAGRILFVCFALTNFQPSIVFQNQ